MEHLTEYVLRLTLTEHDAQALMENFNDMTALPPAVLSFTETLTEFLESLGE